MKLYMDNIKFMATHVGVYLFMWFGLTALTSLTEVDLNRYMAEWTWPNWMVLGTIVIVFMTLDLYPLISINSAELDLVGSSGLSFIQWKCFMGMYSIIRKSHEEGVEMEKRREPIGPMEAAFVQLILMKTVAVFGTGALRMIRGLVKLGRMEKWRLFQDLVAESVLELVLALAIGVYYGLLIGLAHLVGRNDEEKENLGNLIHSWKDVIILVGVWNIFPALVRKWLNFKDLDGLSSGFIDTMFLLNKEFFFEYQMFSVGSSASYLWFSEYLGIRSFVWLVSSACYGLNTDFSHRLRIDGEQRRKGNFVISVFYFAFAPYLLGYRTGKAIFRKEQEHEV